jgi:phytoene dehydrogenase-like protein
MPQRLVNVGQRKACVIGAGPNGLAAAIVLARAGMEVEVFEAEAEVGGAARTMELTLPGFRHDFGSAVHPMAAGSPFFASLPLRDYGLEWIHSPAALAHPFDDGTAIALEQDLARAEEALGEDGGAWRGLMEPLASQWTEFAGEILRPAIAWPKHPLMMARFGLKGLQPASGFARRQFRSEKARALFGGLAAHSCLALDKPLSASFGLVLGVTAHAVGWPIPRGGAQSIADAMARYLRHLGGRITTDARIVSLSDLPPCEITMCDVSPRQLIALAGEGATGRLSQGYRSQLAKYRYGPAAFKVDFALSQPIPWNAPECLRAATVHVGGALAEIEASESAMASGHTAAKPFVLVAQPTLFDPTRAPHGKHIAWAYCHVPNGATQDMLERIETQIERFANGFRDCILARCVFSPAGLEAMDANLIGGDVGGGAVGGTQLFLRPTWRQYRTSAKGVYLCSASTSPGGGVHGMCGANAAEMALRDFMYR